VREGAARDECFGRDILMQIRGYFALVSAFMAPLSAQETRLTRDGAFWVQTITGSDPAAPRGRLRVSTQGPVTIRGGAEGRTQYTVTRRVKARNENEARLML